MRQNKYDDAAFFAKYREMPRSIGGLEAAGEWHELRAMLPDFQGKRVLDLGCGYGWHCRYAREMGAEAVLGIDISEKMLAQARRMTNDAGIEYRQQPIEEFDVAAESFDVVLSSLALHYVEDFAQVCRKVHDCLVPAGVFVMSVEHPIHTARAEQDWHYGSDGERLHWPVDHYQDEGKRLAQFLGHDVVKYHRTIATYFNTLLAAGFSLRQVSEPQPTAEALATQSEMRDEVRRPMFLMVSAVKV